MFAGLNGNGQKPLQVTIMGNGLLPGNKLAVIPMEQSCGQADWNRTLPHSVTGAPTQQNAWSRETM